MTTITELAPVLGDYPSDLKPDRVEFLASAGGFSGARLWKLFTSRGPLCLRRWPAEYPSTDQLQFIQAVLWHVHREGFDRVPLPLETRAHAGYVCHDDHLWQLEPWLPGQADYWSDPRPEKLQAALTALAQFHAAAAPFPLPEIGPAPAPGIVRRLARLKLLGATGAATLAAAVRPGGWPEMAERAQRLLQLFAMVRVRVESLAAGAARLQVPWQPCIRDIWHDHVLFSGTQVTGLIDFGGLRPDNVATDVARLLGSLAADDRQGWQTGLQAYEAVRPLSRDEHRLVMAFDQTSVLLGGLEWIEWIYVEGRRFDDHVAVEKRLDRMLARLAHLATAG